MRRSAHGVLGLAFLLGAAACTPDARPLPEVPSEPTGEGAAPAAVPQKAWTYQGETGPEKWAALDPEFAACAAVDQSPVDLPLDGLGKTAADPTLAISVDLPRSPLQAASDGRTVTLQAASAPSLTIGGQPSAIEKIEFHVPAEHLLGGARLDAELVLHAKGADGRPILLSLLYRTGAESPAWAPLLAQLPAAGVYRAHPLGPQATLAALLPATAEIFVYEGSLSTPPCSPATRLVVAYVGEMSSAQLARLRQAVPESARPPAALGQRTITFRSLSTSGTSPKAPDKQTP